MPGQQLQTTAFLLARKPSGADAFEQVTAFGEEHGLLACLFRLSRKASASSVTPPDLFDEAELWLESSNQGRTWFIKEHRILARHAGVGRSYEALQTASALATLIARNPVDEDSRGALMNLLRQSLAALEQGARPDLVWFKALFCFLRDEGYPVKQQWWAQLPAPDGEAAAQILNQPVATQNPEPKLVASLTRQLQDWIAQETEVRV